MTAPVEHAVPTYEEQTEPPINHLFCGWCHSHEPGVGVAICGVKSTREGQLISEVGLPPDCCETCYSTVCHVCFDIAGE